MTMTLTFYTNPVQQYPTTPALQCSFPFWLSINMNQKLLVCNLCWNRLLYSWLVMMFCRSCRRLKRRVWYAKRLGIRLVYLAVFMEFSKGQFVVVVVLAFIWWISFLGNLFGAFLLVGDLAHCCSLNFCIPVKKGRRTIYFIEILQDQIINQFIPLHPIIKTN